MPKQHKGQFECEDDLLLAFNHIRNWTFLEDIPQGGAAAGQILVWDDDDRWTPSSDLTLANLVITNNASGITWDMIEDKPSVSLITHTHTVADVTDFDPTNLKKGGVEIQFDNGSVTLVTGLNGIAEIPYSGEITAVRVYSTTSGTVQIDVWKNDITTSVNATNADSICGGDEPALSGAVRASVADLSNWNTTISAGDVLHFNIDSVSTVSKVTLFLAITKDST
jgi:hypothetical protein